MTPHSAALLAVGCYLYKGGTGASFKVELTGYRRSTYYVRAHGGDTFRVEKSGDIWSCTCRMEIRPPKITIRSHKHLDYTPLEENCYVSVDSLSGSVANSIMGFNGSFSGQIESSDGRKVRINGTKGTYNIEVSNY